MVLAFGRMARLKVLSFLTSLYFDYAGNAADAAADCGLFAPYYVFGMKISKSYRMIAVILAFVLNYAAYFAEIYRSGIESMPVGQYEAAKVLGYSRVQTFFRIILPQVIKRVLPAVTNEMITLVKDTSLGLCADSNGDVYDCKADCSGTGFCNATDGSRVFYYILILVIAVVMEHVEKKFKLLPRIMQDARETVRGQLLFCSQTEIQERYDAAK